MGRDPLIQRLYGGARRRAKRRGLPFTLDIADIVIPKRCPVLGIPLFPGRGSSCGNSPTLDRIIPDVGYVRGNVLVVSLKANAIKSQGSVGDLYRVASFYRQLIEQGHYAQDFLS